MINLNTGEISFGDIKFTGKSKVSDFVGYDESILHIDNRGKGKAIMRIPELIESNGVYASIKMSINEWLNTRRVTITPSLKECGNLSMLEASKLWFQGMVVGEYEETAGSIAGEYSWGHFCAQYRPDRDYGIVGGDIIIVFE